MKCLAPPQQQRMLRGTAEGPTPSLGATAVVMAGPMMVARKRRPVVEKQETHHCVARRVVHGAG
jgi:hypothetical protein